MLELCKPVRVLSVIALTASMLGTAACGDDDSSTGNQLSNADLVGDWTMVSFQLVPQPALTPPAATGSLRLTSTEYRILIVRDGGSVTDTVLSDSGTYEVHGSTWSQTSSNPQLPQTTGTVALMTSGTVEHLEVNASTAGVATHSIWMRQE